MINGFIRVAAAVPRVNVADVKTNVDNIIRMASELDSKGVELAVMPEMCITAYTCGDLLESHTLLEAARAGLERIVEASRQWKLDLVVGLPLSYGTDLRNCAVAIGQGQIKLIVAKEYVPTYGEFYERRWWAPAPPDMPRVFTCAAGVKVGIEICEELWVPTPPSGRCVLEGAQVILNLSASDDSAGKYDYLRRLVRGQSARCHCAYVYASAGYGESTGDVVFDSKLIIAERGDLLAGNRRWDDTDRMAIADVDIAAIDYDRHHTGTFGDCAARAGLSPRVPSTLNLATTDFEKRLDYRKIEQLPFVPSDPAELDERCWEVTSIQTAGLCRRLDFIHCRKVVIGISGGLDSTLALLIAVQTFDRLGLDRSGIIGVTMPGFGTSGRTRSNAQMLMESLGVTIREIPIGPAVLQHFHDIGHDPDKHDVVYENAQARERTQILMDLANEENAIVLGTGDLSELALGWATYNGDQMSMYGINAGVPKTLIRSIVGWYADKAEAEGRIEEARTLRDIVATPVSPELLPADASGSIAQKTEDLVGPYELHDFFLHYTLRYGFSPARIYWLARQAFDGTPLGDDKVLIHWLHVFVKRFFAMQFKRSCMPDGPKVGNVSLSPRGDWRMPSDASATLWRQGVERIARQRGVTL